ncbi:MAG: MFS transporter [Chloroflexi bacterium]|nr:MFS transporter [Chloroflexota bacterium]
MVQYLAAVRRFNQPTVHFVLVCMLHSFAFNGIYTLLVNLYLLRLGYGPAVIGVFNGVANVAAAASALPAALLAGRWHLKTPMVSGLSCSALLIAILPVGELLAGPAQIGWLIAVGALVSLAVSVWFVYGNPFMMTLVGERQRSQAFSIRWALLALGGFAGNLVGGWLPPMYAAITGSSVGSPDPFRYALWTSAALVAIVSIWMTRVSAQRAPEAAGQGLTGIGGAGAAGLVALVLFTSLLLQVTFTSTKIFFNVYMETNLGADTVLIGSLIGAGWLIAAPASLVTPFVTAKLGHGRTVAFAAMIGSFMLLPVALIPRIAAAGAGFLSMSFTIGIFWPAYQVFSMSVVRPDRRPLVYGSIVGAGGLAGTLLGAGGGYLIAAAGFREFFLLSSALTLVGVGVFWLTMVKQAQRTE